jgi:hypothetical protein
LRGQGCAAMSRNESEIRVACDNMVKAGQDLLAGWLSFIEGARQFVAAATTVWLDRRDADLLPFVGIVSETGALPVGEERQYWQAATLAALQSEIDPRIRRTPMKSHRAPFQMIKSASSRASVQSQFLNAAMPGSLSAFGR